MTNPQERTHEVRPVTTDADAGTEAGLRRTLVILGAVVGVAAALHLADHAIRGQIVDENGLAPEWNHSGWPFRDAITPFTASLVIPLVFLAGVLLTRGRRVWAGFWLAWSVVAAAVVIAVHLLPGPRTETFGVIYRSYDRGGVGPVAGGLALLVLVVILGGLAALVAMAIRARRSSGRW